MAILMESVCYILVVGIIGPIVSQNTIQDIIKSRPELSTIASAKYLTSTTVMNYLGTAKSVTFFAPHNDAFLNISSQLRGQLGAMGKDTANNLFMYHTLPNKLWNTGNISSGTGARLATRASGDFLYVYNQNNFYVNGAHIVTPNLVATNGVLHIIDHMFVDAGDTGPTTNAFASTAYDFIGSGYSTSATLGTSEFYALLQNYVTKSDAGTITAGPYGALTDLLADSTTFSTVFVPNDQFLRAFKQNNPSLYTQLTTGDASFMQKVIESQVIPSVAYHSGIFLDLTGGSPDKTVTGMQGNMRMYTFGGQLYVSQSCGQVNVVQANITTNNAVVYIVDGFLGFIYNDLFTELVVQSDLSEFRGAVQAASQTFQSSLKVLAGSSSNIPDNQKYTIFAPKGSVFSLVGFNTGDSTVLQNQINMQIIQGVVDLYQITNATQKETLRSGYFMKFYQIGQDHYVEVDYVRAKILQANICDKNGIIHKIDQILGVPSTTIANQINLNAMLVTLRGVVANSGLQTFLSDKTRQMTFFAPNDTAFAAMDQSYFQQQNNQKLQNIMLRHVSNTILFLDSISSGSQTNLDTFNGKITISNQNNNYYITVGSQTIRVIQANMKMINGVLHIVDKVLYDPFDPHTAESTNTAADLYSTSTKTWLISMYLLVSLSIYNWPL